MRKIEVGGVRVKQTVNTFYLRIPAEAVREMRLQRGDLMDIVVSADRKVIKYRLIPEQKTLTPNLAQGLPCDPAVTVEPDTVVPTLAPPNEPSVPVPEPHTSEKTWWQRISEILLSEGE